MGARPHTKRPEPALSGAKILWLVVKGFVVDRLGVDACGVVLGAVCDERPGNLGEFPSDSIERGGLRQSLGLLACVALGEGAILRAVCSSHGGQIEQAAQLSI